MELMLLIGTEQAVAYAVLHSSTPIALSLLN